MNSESDVSLNQLSKLAKQVVEQIKNKKYDAELSEKVTYIGLAHHNKDAVIEWQEKFQN